jgi:hypothetical protein
MDEYEVHPDSVYGVEMRSDRSIDDYIATARGFTSTAEFREFRDGSPSRREEIRRARARHAKTNTTDDRIRVVELIKAQGNE